MKTVLGVGFEIPSTTRFFLQLDSYSSLSDADIAIFNPNFRYTNYSTSEPSRFSNSHEGKSLYNEESSTKMIAHVNHWKAELLHFLNSGKTLFVILPPRKDFFVHGPKKDAGANIRSHSIDGTIIEFSNYNFIPFDDITMSPSKGRDIINNSSLFHSLFSNFKEYINYEGYITGNREFMTIFSTKDKSRVLGLHMKYNSGNVFMIPNLDLSSENLKKYVTKKATYEWKEDAIKLGKTLVNNLCEIDRIINETSEKSATPEWANDAHFDLVEAVETKKKIFSNEKYIKLKEEENIELTNSLREQEVLKNLLFETGKPLELAVTKALNILGYKAEGFDNGTLELDQIIVSPEGERYIGECEGKDNKDIDISKFRQLSESLSADFERDEVSEKALGLLIGNPQRLLNPKDRTLDFTQKCKLGAAREKIGLIRTTDLFYAVRYIIEKKDELFKLECRKAILNCLGKVVEFPKIPSSDKQERIN